MKIIFLTQSSNKSLSATKPKNKKSKSFDISDYEDEISLFVKLEKSALREWNYISNKVEIPEDVPSYSVADKFIRKHFSKPLAGNELGYIAIQSAAEASNYHCFANDWLGNLRNYLGLPRSAENELTELIDYYRE